MVWVGGESALELSHALSYITPCVHLHGAIIMKGHSRKVRFFASVPTLDSHLLLGVLGVQTQESDVSFSIDS